MEVNTECEGVKIGGRNVNNIRNADDVLIVMDSEEKLLKLVDTRPFLKFTKLNW